MKKCLKNDLHLLENYDYNMLCIYFISIKYKKLKFIYIQILFVFHEIKNYILVIEPSFLTLSAVADSVIVIIYEQSTCPQFQK